MAGGINSETAALAIEAGASIVIVGGAIMKATDAAAATRPIKQAMADLVSVRSEYFVRAMGPDLREMLSRVSAANVSDALHRTGDVAGMRPLTPGAKVVGPAFTVRTYPGDWAKPVEAIDVAAGRGRDGHRRRWRRDRRSGANWPPTPPSSARSPEWSSSGRPATPATSASLGSRSSAPSSPPRRVNPRVSARSAYLSRSPASAWHRATGSSATTTACA